MTRESLPVIRLLLLVMMLVAVSVLMGWLVTSGRDGYILPVAVLVVVLAWRLVNVYRRIVRNLDFIFGAVRNNDFSFRFVENPLRTEHSVVNHSLNRIKEVLDEAKMKALEKERYFEAVIECANVGIVILLENGAVVQNNSKALKLLGVPVLGHVGRLQGVSQSLAETLLKIAPMEKRSVCFSTESGEVNLLLSCSVMQYEGQELRIVSIEDINRELDMQEGLAWEKLTRILTHEIMNSLAPVTSISGTLLNSKGNAEVLQQGLETIHGTSDRLMKFVDSFRSVTRIPLPKKEPFYLLELFNEAVPLIAPGNIRFVLAVDPKDTMILR